MRKVLIMLFSFYLSTTCIAQVNYQTGSAVYSIPVFNWADNLCRLNTTIALNYSSGNGLKVNDVASNVGQGWNLTAGGVITRMQVGEPDDQKPYSQGGAEQWSDTKKYPPGYLYNTQDITKGVSASLEKYPIFREKNNIYRQYNEVAGDREMDYFSFQYNGKTGMFFLDKLTGQGVSMEDQRIKIWYVRNEGMSAFQIRTTIVAFYIQDIDGLTYKFTKYATTKLLKTKYCNPDLNGTLTQPTFKNNKVYHEAGFEDAEIVNPYIINEWHLEEIEDAFTHRKVTFTYVARNISTNAGTAITNYDDHTAKNYSVITHMTSKSQTFDLSTINYPDGHQVVFNYGAARVDLTGAYALASIDVKYGGNYVSRTELTTSYFILNRMGTPTTDYQKSVARLCLKKIKKDGPYLKDDEPPYLFDYYMGSNTADDIIPPAFSHLKDIWGFYNGTNSKAFDNSAISTTAAISSLTDLQLRGLCFQRTGSSAIELNPKSGYAKNGLLKQVSLPTGGALMYEYEQNTGVFEGESTSRTMGGVHVSKTSLTDGGYSNGCDNPLVKNYTYTAALTGSESSMWGAEAPRNSITVNSHYQAQSKYFYYKPIANFGCKYRYQFPGILSRDQAVDLTGHQKFMQAFSQIMDLVSSGMQVFDIVSVCISATPAAILAVVLDVIGSIVNIILTCFADVTQDSVMTMSYNSDLNGSNPLPCQFKRVEISDGPGTNGKTVLEFTSKTEAPLWEPTNTSFSMKQRFGLGIYGLLKKETILGQGDILVKTTENSYDYKKDNFTVVGAGHEFVFFYPNCKYLITSNTSQRYDEWTAPANYLYPDTYIASSSGSIIVDMYQMHASEALLTSTLVKTYNAAGTDFLATKESFTYSQITYSSPTPPITSHHTYYLLNSDMTEFAAGNKEYNSYGYTFYITDLFVLPTSITKGISRPGSGNKVVSKEENIYGYISTGDLRHQQTLTTRYNEPDGTPATAVSTLLEGYDSLGNLETVKDEGGRTVEYLYDYDNKFRVATITNSDNNDLCAYTSFETASLGGFSYSGTPTYVTTKVATGKRSLSITSGASLTASLNPAKGYKLSFWSSAALTVGAGSTLKTSVNDSYVSTYYEYDIAPGTSTISITGTGGGAKSLDEVRLYPATARMNTVAYDPILGKTAECDENNRIRYFDYDNLGRLEFIRDEHRFVAKMYEYNIAKKAICPVTYTNLVLSEQFVKNNCPGGSIGSTVTYTIPAATYTSTYSQDAVDQQVENDLNANGQNYANTNGTCITVYKNALLSTTFYKEGCPVGYTGSAVAYTVPANKYSSLVNQADADQQAQDELDANGQALANLPGVGNCEVSNEPDWIGTGEEACSNRHRMKKVIDQNPNSPTYGLTQWIDSGFDPNCPANSCSSYTVTFTDDVMSRLTITYVQCGTTEFVTHHMNQELVSDDGNGTYILHVCSTVLPTLNYGTPTPLVLPTVVFSGSCP